MNVLELPDDILLCILGWLPTSPLLLVSVVNRRLRRLVDQNDILFSFGYGQGPFHRLPLRKKCEVGTTFRQLTREKHEYRRGLEEGERQVWTPEYGLDQLLEEWYLTSEECLHEVASEVLLALQSQERNNGIWKEAAAMALASQSRAQESMLLFDDIIAEHGCLSSRMCLTARFGWLHQNLSLSDSNGFTELALVGAARGGHLMTIQELRLAGTDLDCFVLHHSAATAAAVGGHSHVLEFLHNQGVNIQIVHETEKPPLWEAAKYGMVLTAEYLMSLGLARSEDILDAYEIAIRSGEPEVLKAILSKRPDVNNECPARWLRAACSANSMAGLKYLVGEAGTDANIYLDDGKAAIHITAEEDKPEHLSELLKVGARTDIEDAVGRSPLEIAINRKHDGIVQILAPLADSYLASEYCFSTQKLQDVCEIWSSLRPLVLEMLARFHGTSFNGFALQEKVVTAESKWVETQMDSKVSDLWVSSMSAQSLRVFLSVIINTDLWEGYHRLCSTYWEESRNCHHDPIGENELQVPQVVQRVSTLFFPSLSNIPVCCRQHVLRKIDDEVRKNHLARMDQFLRTPVGLYLAEGFRAKLHQETLLFHTFLS